MVSGRWTRGVEVMGAQMGKTASTLDIMGERISNSPAPILYVGPTQQFVEEQFAPRFSDLLDQSERLNALRSRTKREKATLRRVAGVPIRLAHAGSSSALKSDPAAIGIVDEYDEMLANVKGQGDPLGLVQARGDTYADFLTIVTSTPSLGIVDVIHDDASGLDFWARTDPADIQSPIWRLLQEGTMHHWAWPCPHCRKMFVPRMRNLRFEVEWRPARVRRETVMVCPHGCAEPIEDSKHKAWMNEHGKFIAPGQWFDADGNVVGEPEDTDTFSTWTSGLCSPFRSFGDRAASLVEAMQSGEPGKVQTATNAGFGELYAAGGGEVPEWQAVQNLRRPYAAMTIPKGVKVLTASADVHKDRINVVVRGWGHRATSWKILSEALYGPTTDGEVWSRLEAVLQARYEFADGSGSLPVKIAFVDSGFRPGKPDAVPENTVYEFCRRHQRFVFPTKGSSRPLITPLVKSKIEVETSGKGAAYGLVLFRLDTDVWKSWVHERIRWDPERPGGWFLDERSDDDFARQIVSEARVRTAAGKATWVQRSKRNHFLDCEAMNAAAGFLLGVQYIGSGQRPPPDPTAEAPPADPLVAPAPPAPLTAAEISAAEAAKIDPTGTASAIKPAAGAAKANYFAMLSARMNRK